jgi:hypothetical protein
MDVKPADGSILDREEIGDYYQYNYCTSCERIRFGAGLPICPKCGDLVGNRVAREITMFRYTWIRHWLFFKKKKWVRRYYFQYKGRG